jgi:hypothetical protein
MNKIKHAVIALFLLAYQIFAGFEITETIRLPSDPQLFGITYGNDKFVAVGCTDKIFTSYDAKTWTSNQISLDPNQACLNSVIYEKNMFWAVGNKGIKSTSDNGTDWIIPSGADNLFIFNSITYANDMFVGVGDNGMVATSADGILWKKNNLSGAGQISAVAYGNGIFVAVSKNAAILTSPDAGSWEIKYLSHIKPLYFVTYINNRFLAVGSTGTILLSPNGTDWTEKYSGSDKYLFSAAYGDSTYVVVGGGAILTSRDAETWTQIRADSSLSLTSVVFANKLFVISSYDGKILVGKSDNTPVACSPETNKNAGTWLTVEIFGNTINANLPYKGPNDRYEIRIFNVKGKQIYHSVANVKNGVLNIPSQRIPAGKYFLRVSSNNKTIMSAPFIFAK